MHLDGHSRGGLTIGNALESLSKLPISIINNKAILAKTSINLFSSAYNVNDADKLLADLQNRDDLTPTQKQKAIIKYQTHKDDFVSVLLGGNKATYGKTPDDSNKLREWANMLRDGDSAHNCYGASEKKCEDYGTPEFKPASVSILK